MLKVGIPSPFKFLYLTQWGYTALLRAAQEGHAELVRMLLQDFDSTVDEVDQVSLHPGMCATQKIGRTMGIFCFQNLETACLVFSICDRHTGECSRRSIIAT